MKGSVRDVISMKGNNDHHRQRWALILTMILLAGLLVAGCGVVQEIREEPAAENTLDPDGFYTSKEAVALYLHLYGEIPSNYITKSEATSLGWVPSQGNLWEVTDRKSIGGDRFGNREGLLPAKEGRQYYECDIHYEGGFRGAERIVYSNDGLVYYTADHYATFELLYGEE